MLVTSGQDKTEPADSPSPVVGLASARPPVGASEARLVALACAAISIAVGALTLTGWTFGLPRLIRLSPSMVGMKANAALGVLLAGIVLATATSPGWRRFVARAAATVTLFLGAATLAEYLLGANFGIDEALFRDLAGGRGTSHAGRMSPVAAIDLVLLSATWLLPRRRSSMARWLAHLPVFLVLLSSLISMCGYLYGAPGLYGVAAFTYVAPQTCLAFGALAIGFLASRSDEGIIGQLTRNDAGGVLMRRMLPASIAVPLVIGAMRLWGQRAGLYGTEMGLSLFACSNVVLFVSLICLSAAALSRHDLKRYQAEEALKKINETLEGRILERTGELAETNANLHEQIAERTRVAEALQQGEERYRSLARSMPNAASLMFDHDLRFVMAEGALLEALNLSSEKLVGKTFSELSTSGTQEVVERLYRAALAGLHGTLDLPTSGRWVRLHTAPIYDAAGTITHGMVFFYDMTAFAETADVLKESEARLQGLSEAAFEGIALVDEGTIIDANSALAAMFGRVRQELVRLPWRDLLAPGDRDAALAHVRSGAGEARESIGVRADGQQFPIEVRGRRIHREGRELDAIAIQDLSLRRRDEAARQRSEDQFSRLMEAMPQGIAVVRDARFVYANRTQAEILGFDSPSSMVGESIWPMLHPSELQKRTTSPGAGPVMGQVGPKVVRCVKRDGSEIWVDTVSLSMDLEDGPGILVISRDVTRERELEAQARATTTLWRAILDGAEHSIIATTPDGMISEFNPAAERLLGYSAEEVVGQATPAIIHDPSEVEARARALSIELGIAIEPGFESFVAKARRGHPDHNEWTYIRKDGSRLPVRVSVTALRGPAGELDGFLGIASDITEAKRAEAELIKARDAAEHAMRARSDFLARMSHEIRTPMNGILGMTELALHTQLSGEQRDYLETTEVSARTLLSLINEILDFSKIDSGKLRLEVISFRPEQVLGGALRPLAVLAQRKGLELLLEVAPNVPKGLMGDPKRLAQIVTNLVGNAIKFTERGEIVVALSAGRRNDETVDLEVEVRDSGIGIPVDKQKAIFEAFSQVDEATTRNYGGTGLGLAICAQLVELMGGKISVRSELGQGSRFLVRVPLQVDRGAIAGQPTLESLRGLRALLVDDHATSRNVVQTMLDSWQIETIAVAGHEAIDSARQARAIGAPVGLIIINADTATADQGAGVQTLRRECAAGVGLVLLGGMEGAVGHETASAIGPHVLVSKPVLVSALLEGIEAVLTDPSVVPSIYPVTSLLVPISTPLRILVVDDNAINRKVVGTMLAKAGHQIESVHDGPAAVAAVGRQRFDLVLMDVEMPSMDGLEATRAIRSAGSSVPIIALTAQAMKGDEQRCLAAGMDDYLSKPINRKELLQAIGKAVRSAGTRPAEQQIHRRESESPPVIALSPFDEKELLERVDGDRVLMAELVRLFLRDAPPLMETVRQGAAAGDARIVERAAHGLSGILLNMAAHPASDSARSLEESARAGNLAQAPAMIKQIDKEMHLLLAAMDSKPSPEGFGKSSVL